MVLHGTLRELLLTPIVGPLVSHQVSSLTASLLIVFVTWFLVPWIHAATQRDQIRLGLAWLTLTVAFEFGFGHWAAGYCWSDLVADYNLSTGRLWILVLVATAVAPRFVGWMDRPRTANKRR